MMSAKFKPGDLVVIIADDADCIQHLGKVGSVQGLCISMSIVSAFTGGPPYYHLTCLDPIECAREDALKLIDGDGEKRETHRKRDEPVPA